MLYSELRKDYFLNKYVVIVPRRSKRIETLKEQVILAPAKTCPFCPQSPIKQETIKVYRTKDERPWSVWVIKNKFPVTEEKNQKFYGRHEVVIETVKHNKEFAQFSVGKISQILKVYADRVKAISQDKKIEYILVFKNDGGLAGASIIHSHSQIFASQFLPPDVLEEVIAAREYRIKEKKCPYCAIIEKEKRGPRLIEADSYIVAFTPFASFYNYEAWIFPRRHIDNVTNLNHNERKSFARVLKKILTKVEKMNLSYNFFLHQVISEPDQHFYLKVQPRRSIWGGIELGSGLMVNTVSPEKAAAYYRQ
jgi:UDPglucose--hexose-1-phosphate uridylyltransferase